jgi:hypothetical protein
MKMENKQQEQQQENRINRNGRNRVLTSWNIEAQDYFKNLYSLYSQFKDKIYLEETDINFLVSCYNGKDYQNKIEILKRFIARQFKLMGYPQQEGKTEQRKGYIEIINGLIVLNFGYNAQQINKALFDEYMQENPKTQKNEAHISPIIKEKQEGNNKPLTEIAYKKQISEAHHKKIIEALNKHKEDLDIYDNTYINDLKGGWE